MKSNPVTVHTEDANIAITESYLKLLQERCDDADSPARLSNLLFYGLDDRKSETWAESEQIVRTMCAENLAIAPDDFAINEARHFG